MEEGKYDRGVYLVEIDRSGITADLKRDYYQRSIVRLGLTARGEESLEELQELAIATVQKAIQSRQLIPADAPIVELRITGQVGFDRLELDTRKLQQELQKLSSALIFLLKYDVNTLEYGSPIAEEASRLQIEQEVFTDLLAAHNTYKKQAGELVHGLLELKDLQLQGRSEPELYEFVETMLNPVAE